MADTKLSALTSATPAAGDLVYLVQNGNSRRTTAQAIANLAPATNLSYDPATGLLSSSTGADVTLTLADAANPGLLSAAGFSKLASITVDRATLTVATVRNATGSPIAKGTPVYVTGSSGLLKTVAPADASLEATAANTFGVTFEAIGSNANGLVVTEGELSGVDTGSLTEGALVFLSETTGGLTSTRPTQPAHGVVIGFCVKQGGGTAGTLYVKVDNGLEINELHDVLITSPATGQVIRRASDGLWKNAQLAAADLSGLGTAALANTGTAAGNVVVLDGSARLPAVDGSQLTGLPGGGGGGTKTYAVFTPDQNQPPSTAFATLDTRNSILVLDFDDGATNEAAVFCGVIPEGATLTSGLKVRIHWMATSATSGNCRWGVQFEKSGTDLDADSFDTATEAHSATNGTSGIETVTEITATAIDSLAAGDRFRLKVYRDSSDTTNDTMTGDAELIAIEIRGAA